MLSGVPLLDVLGVARVEVQERGKCLSLRDTLAPTVRRLVIGDHEGAGMAPHRVMNMSAEISTHVI